MDIVAQPAVQRYFLFRLSQSAGTPFPAYSPNGKAPCTNCVPPVGWLVQRPDRDAFSRSGSRVDKGPGPRCTQHLAALTKAKINRVFSATQSNLFSTRNRLIMGFLRITACSHGRLPRRNTGSVTPNL